MFAANDKSISTVAMAEKVKRLNDCIESANISSVRKRPRENSVLEREAIRGIPKNERFSDSDNEDASKQVFLYWLSSMQKELEDGDECRDDDDDDDEDEDESNNDKNDNEK
jgi:hypothetical protein